MRFRTDERGVTVQVGTVLLFAVLIILLSTYQASIVPQQNEQVEYTHNQQVQGQLQDLRDELLRTAVTGSSGSVSVSLGTNYPVRAFFVNPAPPSGTLETTSPATLTVENATGIGETGDYWTGRPRNFSTRRIVYDPFYHVYDSAPVTVYDNGVLYNRFDGANRTLTGQRLVKGNRISLVAVGGSLAETGTRSATVGFRPVSAATRTVTIRNQTANLSVVVPTARPADEWRDLLAPETSQTPNDDRYVLAVEPGPRPGTVRIVLEPGTYELRLAKVGVGTDVAGVEAHYVTKVGDGGTGASDGVDVTENSSETMVVEVRDRYNNPVSDATVNVTLVSSLSGDTISAQGQHGATLTNLTTDNRGRVPIAYDAPADVDGDDVTVEIRVSLTATPATGPAFAPGARTNLSFGVTAVNADGSGQIHAGGGGGGAYLTRWNVSAIRNETGVTCYGNDTCRYDRAVGESVTLSANTTPVADGGILEFVGNDTGVGAFNTSAAITSDDGRVQVSLDTNAVGNLTAYVSGGGSGDALEIDVYNSGSASSGWPPHVDTFDVVDESTCDPHPRFRCNPGSNAAKFDVNWHVGDRDDDLQSVTVYVNESGTNQITYDGSSGDYTYQQDGAYGEDFTVKLVATDAEGNEVCEVVAETADGGSGDQTQSSC